MMAAVISRLHPSEVIYAPCRVAYRSVVEAVMRINQAKSRRWRRQAQGKAGDDVFIAGLSRD
jgi:hypothetical protein